MTAGVGKCSKIRCIVRLRQQLLRWRQKAALAARNSGGKILTDVPAGYVAVNVGINTSKRYIVRATYLNNPIFEKLLVQAEEEYGFINQVGPLTIPCDESVFEDILRFLSRSDSTKSARFFNLHRGCNSGLRSNLDFHSESRPLLNGHGPVDKSVW